MRSSSTRRRLGAALTASSLALVLGLGGSAYAGESRGAEHRNERADRGGAHHSEPITETEDTDTTDEADTGQTPNDVVDDGDNLHPSGRDRSVENGGSGNQGQSTADPDGDTNGGADKPGMAGGDDLNDQDGNNGCGNDDDFEDDNNGNCGGRRPATPPVVGGDDEVKTCPDGTSLPAGGTAPKDCVGSTTVVTGTPGTVLDTQVQTPAPVQLAATETRAAEVLGVTIERPAVAAAPAAPAAAPSVLGATLARTGFGTALLALLGLALVLFGVAVKRAA
ncbi:MAG TPA: hypothetical protein VM933_09295 [Acidimicrobiales bacterium]|nr:hypothetical protein [Acidimicrobiales bacterium]